mmetsp:Transcript_123670/g.276241  ORF Transcript_123670/g.276241 Transcript_123670/m.276241 type:complete len:646 (-) Transcript_123670:81-2018(-)
MSSFSACLLLVAGWTLRAAIGSTCPGTFNMIGHGKVSLVPTGWPKVDGLMPIVEGAIVPHMGGRAYFANTCTAGHYDHKQYLALNLLGKTMSFTTDMSKSGCGCNAALYLVSMAQNTHPSECNDYYCDANNVCGESCAEIDIQEANMYAWHSTLHSWSDRAGKGSGFGGGNGWEGPRDWAAEDYAPGGRCIDTMSPFDVAVSFPVDAQGQLVAMSVVLSQKGSPCDLRAEVRDYPGMRELSGALAAGMMPAVSYWSSKDMLWLDGRGTDSKGPCKVDLEKPCADAVRFYNFTIEDCVTETVGKESRPTLAHKVSQTTAAPPPASTPISRPASSTLKNVSAVAPHHCGVPTKEKVECGHAHITEAQCQKKGCCYQPTMESVPWCFYRQGDLRVKSKQAPAPSSCSGMAENCMTSRCCNEPGYRCYSQNGRWAGCKASCVLGVAEPADPKDMSPWACTPLGKRAAGKAFIGEAPAAPMKGLAQAASGQKEKKVCGQMVLLLDGPKALPGLLEGEVLVLGSGDWVGRAKANAILTGACESENYTAPSNELQRKDAISAEAGELGSDLLGQRFQEGALTAALALLALEALVAAAATTKVARGKDCENTKLQGWARTASTEEVLEEMHVLTGRAQSRECRLVELGEGPLA